MPGRERFSLRGAAGRSLAGAVEGWTDVGGGAGCGRRDHGRRTPKEGVLRHTITYANAWVASVDGAARRLPGWAAAGVAVLTLASATLGGVALYRLVPAPGAGVAAALLDRALQYLLILGPLYLVALGVGLGFERRAARVPAVGATTAGPIGAALGGGFFLLALGLLAAAHGVRPGGGAGAADHRLTGALLLALLILFQAGAEEAFFRGWLQPVLAARWGPWVGLGATAVLFAAAHAAASAGVRPLGVLAWVNDTLAGVAFGLLALRTGGLVAPLAAHWAWNWVEAGGVGATPNPGVDPLGALFDLDLAGPAWLAGGPDEMNGSVCATVALAGLIACAVLWRPGAASSAPALEA